MVQLSSDCPQFFEFSSMADMKEIPLPKKNAKRSWRRLLKREAKNK